MTGRQGRLPFVRVHLIMTVRKCEEKGDDSIQITSKQKIKYSIRKEEEWV